MIFIIIWRENTHTTQSNMPSFRDRFTPNIISIAVHKVVFRKLNGHNDNRCKNNLPRNLI